MTSSVHAGSLQRELWTSGMPPMLVLVCVLALLPLTLPTVASTNGRKPYNGVQPPRPRAATDNCCSVVASALWSWALEEGAAICDKAHAAVGCQAR